ACSACHAKRGDAWAARAMEEWRGGSPLPADFAVRLHAREGGGSAARRELESLMGDANAPPIARATALLELEAEPRRDEIERAARSPEPLLRLAAARSASGLSPRERVLGIVHLLDDPLRAVRIEAANSLAEVPDDGLPEPRRASRSRALEEYRAALTVASDSPAAHANLAVILHQQEDLAAAEAAYQTALRLGDTFVPAYSGLVDLYAAQERNADAAALLHRGLERMPESADLHYMLGVLLLRQEKNRRAIDELAKAARFAPESAYFTYVYALALSEDRHPAKALAALRAAVKLHPADQNLLGAIATIARGAGRYDEALAAAKRLAELFPDQPEARAMLEDIESRRAGGPGVPAPADETAPAADTAPAPETAPATPE
ncbi:MAG TPA: tetratricopeptide repeat protein, partial [Myxococcota bacterium]|nr:tetratricopeptide repeat protein [Myxococcota bacterium]